jgi:hypothetical protein
MGFSSSSKKLLPLGTHFGLGLYDVRHSLEFIICLNYMILTKDNIVRSLVVMHWKMILYIILKKIPFKCSYYPENKFNFQSASGGMIVS